MIIKYFVAFTRIFQVVAIFNNVKLCNTFKKSVSEGSLIIQRFLNYLLKSNPIVLCEIIALIFSSSSLRLQNLTEQQRINNNNNNRVSLPGRDFHGKWSDEKTDETSLRRSLRTLKYF